MMKAFIFLCVLVLEVSAQGDSANCTCPDLHIFSKAAVGAFPSCPADPEWSLVGRFCVKFIKEKLDFTSAERRCEAEKLGARLISVKDNKENVDLDKFTQDQSREDPRIWLGGLTVRHPHTGDDFMWLDATAMLYKKWHVGEPTGDGDCMEMNWLEKGDWNDIPCDHLNYFVCAINK